MPKGEKNWSAWGEEGEKAPLAAWPAGGRAPGLVSTKAP